MLEMRVASKDVESRRKADVAVELQEQMAEVKVPASIFSGDMIHVSYEDLEGLITNLGILSALMLSFMIGLFFTIPMEEMEIGNYFLHLRGWIAFRRDIVLFLDSKNYNYTVYPPIPQMDGMTVKEILQSCPMLYGAGIPFSNWEKRMDSVFHLTKNVDGIIDYSNAYSSESMSDRIYFQASISLLLTTAALMVSITLYLTLALSKAREDQGATLKKFNKFTLPVIGIAYFFMFSGMVVFFIATCNVVGARNPSFSSFLRLRNTFLLGIFIPLGLLILGGSGLVLYYTNPNLASTDTPKRRISLQVVQEEDSNVNGDNIDEENVNT